jgi:hypothetical protein
LIAQWSFSSGLRTGLKEFPDLMHLAKVKVDELDPHPWRQFEQHGEPGAFTQATLPRQQFGWL